MKDIMRKLSSTTTEHVLLESTRAFIEKFVSDLIAEDMKDPEIRAWLFGQVRWDYETAVRKLGFPGAKRRGSRKRSGFAERS